MLGSLMNKSFKLHKLKLWSEARVSRLLSPDIHVLSILFTSNTMKTGLFNALIPQIFPKDLIKCSVILRYLGLEMRMASVGVSQD
ncbi:hypothetical protein NL676_021020 [Syzygium grande]|nr:hypothetical protein NL676_021017 [Syzygium grande]KAI6693310.1 hypothetical protein NL676_021020 [Syzygium grande]